MAPVAVVTLTVVKNSLSSITHCIAVVVLATVGACHASSRVSFDETVAMFHDDLRWGRLPAAEGAVEPEMREAFNQHHQSWGGGVHVMDIEIETMRASSARSSARLRVTWTLGIDSTDLRESLVEENWESTAGVWRLRNEAVVAGDPGLFGTPTTRSEQPPAQRAQTSTTPPG
jgi:hypothetical protein